MHNVVVSLKGDFDIFRRKELLRALHSQPSDCDLVLDFSSVSHIDSTIMSVLVTFAKDRGANMPIAVIAPYSSIWTIWNIVRMPNLFRTYDTLAQARQSFRR